MINDFYLGNATNNITITGGINIEVRGITLFDIMKDNSLFDLPFIYYSYIKEKYENGNKNFTLDEELIIKCHLFSNIGDYVVYLEDYDLVLSKIAELSMPVFIKDPKAPKVIKKEQQNEESMQSISDFKMQQRKAAKIEYLERLGINESIYSFIKMYLKLKSIGIDCLNSTLRVIYNTYIAIDDIEKESRINNMQDDLAVSALFNISKDGHKIYSERIKELIWG